MLIVGGAGLIGRALAPALLERGLVPVAVSRHAPPPGVLPEGAIHLCADRRELPARIASGAVFAGAVEILAEGPEEVAPLLAALGENARFVAIGSAAVFGGAAAKTSFAESDLPVPLTPPMRRKVELERLVAAQSSSGRGATLLRIAYPYGPGHGPLTPLGRDRGLFAALQSGAAVDWVTANAFAPLQPLWVDDLARGIAALLCQPVKPRPLYHVAGPATLDWDAYLAALLRGLPAAAVARHSVEALGRLRPEAAWLAGYLTASPLLDDRLFRREVHACDTTLASAVDRWAVWCSSGAA